MLLTVYLVYFASLISRESTKWQHDMTSMSIHEYGVAPDEVQCMFCDEGNISGFY